MLLDKFANHATYQVNEFQIQTLRNVLKHPEIPQDYARRIRESAPGDGGGVIGGGSIGIATISSITVGIISILFFGLLVFLAVAKRRRRNSEGDFGTATSATPSQSRTTISGTPPVMTKVRFGTLIDISSTLSTRGCKKL